MPDRDGWSAANMIADAAPTGLRVVTADVESDTVTITYKLREGWTWNDLTPGAEGGRRD